MKKGDNDIPNPDLEELRDALIYSQIDQLPEDRLDALLEEGGVDFEAFNRRFDDMLAQHTKEDAALATWVIPKARSILRRFREAIEEEFSMGPDPVLGMRRSNENEGTSRSLDTCLPKDAPVPPDNLPWRVTRLDVFPKTGSIELELMPHDPSVPHPEEPTVNVYCDGELLDQDSSRYDTAQGMLDIKLAGDLPDEDLTLTLKLKPENTLEIHLDTSS